VGDASPLSKSGRTPSPPASPPHYTPGEVLLYRFKLNCVYCVVCAVQSSQSKLEKADILEMTVKHLRTSQRLHRQLSHCQFHTASYCFSLSGPIACTALMSPAATNLDVVCLLEHSNSRFESIPFVMRIDSFCKKSAFRFTSCHAVFALTK